MELQEKVMMEQGTQPEPWLMTEEQAAEVLGVRARLLRDLRRRGDIGFLKVGRLVRYRRQDLQRFIEQNAVEPR